MIGARCGHEYVGHHGKPAAGPLAHCGDDTLDLAVVADRRLGHLNPKGGGGGALPGQALGEAAGRFTQPGHEGRIIRQLQHPSRQCVHVTVGHQKSRLTVADRIPEPRAVGGERGCATRRRLDYRDPPPLLR